MCEALGLIPSTSKKKYMQLRHLRKIIQKPGNMVSIQKPLNYCDMRDNLC
jgi:hypothetical protein